MTENYTEQLNYDSLTEEYFIERSTGYGENEKFERKPLSQWGLQKKFELFVHVFRKIETADFEHPNKIINYKLPVTFEITDSTLGKNIYLKLERQAFDIPIRNNAKANWVRIFLRDLDSGVTEPAPMPNAYFRQEDFSYLKITVGKAIEMTTKQEIIDLWASKKCIGYYDGKIENFIVKGA
jgi:hypothetical protein